MISVTWFRVDYDYFTDDMVFISFIKDLVDWNLAQKGDSYALISSRTGYDLDYVYDSLNSPPLSYRFLKDMLGVFKLTADSLKNRFRMEFVEDEEDDVDAVSDYPYEGDWDDVL